MESLRFIRRYPLELWFPENRYDFNQVLEYADKLSKEYGVQYYCQLEGNWIVCCVLDSVTFSSPLGTSVQTGKTKKRKTLADLLEEL